MRDPVSHPAPKSDLGPSHPAPGARDTRAMSARIRREAGRRDWQVMPPGGRLRPGPGQGPA